MATKVLNIGSSSSSTTVDINENGNLLPQVTNSYNIGSDSLKWLNIYGSLKGNADTSTSTRYVQSPDTRAVVINPSELTSGNGVQFNFKETSVTGLSGYSGVMTYRPYAHDSDWTGGPAHEIAFNASGTLYHRISTGDSSWGSWETLLTSSNYNSYAPTLTGIGASGTWGISITGNADTVDGYHVSDLDSRYVNVSGDTMTGTLQFAFTETSTWVGSAPGISWYGGSDGAQIYYTSPSSDCGELHLNFTDDSNPVFKIGWNDTIYHTFSTNGLVLSNTLGVNGSNTSYNLYVNGTSYFANACYLPSNVSIIQNQASTSNYTTPIKWYQGGSSQNTYDPQIGQHNTGGDGTGSICILPYATSTNPWGGSVGLFIYKNGLKLDGNPVLTSANYTSYCAKASHTHSYLPLSGGTMTGAISFNPTDSSDAAPYICSEVSSGVTRLIFRAADDANDGFTFRCRYWNDSSDTDVMVITYSNITCNKPLYGAVWNDYAEYRKSAEVEPGRVVLEDSKGVCQLATTRLQPFAGVVSDTFGFAECETDDAKTPLAVAGRVLVYPFQERNRYEIGDCVCAAPDGTVDIMTRQEIRDWPDRIVGTVSEIPDYEFWGTGNVKVNQRIWIKIK